ncbi:MAG: hypothetical protein DWQ04_34495 [Chloroflexi bacterium]|nr:MAG: hypothetical protein DWQ04_34495 [Chloroflexota bacterium]
MVRWFGIIKFGFVMLTAVLLGCQADDFGSETAVTPINATADALTTAIAASAEPPVDLQSLQAEIESAETMWRSQNIQNYRIEVRHLRPNWNTQIINITVENGNVLEAIHTCYPERTCMKRDVDPQDLVIVNMFEVARQVVKFTDLHPEVNFNKTYGFPTYISYDDASWILDGFELITKD